MRKTLQLLILAILSFVLGCAHSRVTSSVDVSTEAESVETRNRYEPINKGWCGFAIGAEDFKSCQPKVFASNGIPITLNANIEDVESDWGWTGILSAMTIGALPWIETRHVHVKYTLSLANAPEKSFETCTRRGQAFAWLPLPLLFFNCKPELCFNNEDAVSASNFSCDFEPEKQMVAYGLARRLKELEDAGYVTADVKARQWAQKSVDGEDSSRVTSVFGSVRTSLPFEIVKLECDAMSDFSYRFELAKRGGENLSVSDYGPIRSAFMETIRTHYANEHKEVNSRSLVVDFPEYVVSGKRITGVVTVLILSPQLVSYDSAKRQGRIVAKIGKNQFADARRWMRKNIEAIACDSNIAKEGDDIPAGVRFYIGHEQLGEDGIMEMDFKTE